MSVYAQNSSITTELSSFPTSLAHFLFVGSNYTQAINFANEIGAAYFAAVVPGTPNINFAATFTGQLQVSTGGVYTFCLTSDDGSYLYVDSSTLWVVNDGQAHPIATVCNNDTLAAGVHTLFINYFQQLGYTAMQFTYSGPDTLNKNVLVRINTPGPTSCISCAVGTYSSKNGSAAHILSITIKVF